MTKQAMTMPITVDMDTGSAEGGTRCSGGLATCPGGGGGEEGASSPRLAASSLALLSTTLTLAWPDTSLHDSVPDITSSNCLNRNLKITSTIYECSTYKTFPSTCSLIQQQLMTVSP